MDKPKAEQGVPADLGRVLAASHSDAMAYCASHQTRVLTVFFSDLVGSTAQQRDLGNLRAASLVQRHRAIFREVLARFDGQEMHPTGDSFFAIFAAPSEGMKFALHMQHAMHKARAAEPDLPLVRAGLHQGQVVVEERPGGPKPVDIYGLQVSAAARIMALGTGSQTLCSRTVFDDARAILAASDFKDMAEIAWLNHGAYRFKGVPDAYEVCEAGETGVAPLRAPEAGEKGWPAESAPEFAGWRPGAGVKVPGTNWVLEERLGRRNDGSYRGSFGEVWRAYNPADKSRQAFRFCFNREQAPALKREARLLKRLRSQRHPNLVEVYDVTEGDRPPHYLEMEYVNGPALEAWLAANPPLPDRLEIVAQVADALEAAHMAGIVHCDVRPSNILLARGADRHVLAKLSDFRMGAADDPELLRSVCESREEGMPDRADYCAPELRAGRPPGPQSDIYSLGVTLFQVVTGDLTRWPTDLTREVPAEELREDIARCLAHEPERRFTSAGELAMRLREHAELEAMRVPEAAEPSAPLLRTPTPFELSRGAATTFVEAANMRLLFQPGQLIANQFEVVRELGRGGMGAVYEVRDQLTKQRLALKVILPAVLAKEGAAELFVQEVNIARRLRHQNIVGVYDVRQEGPLLFFTMELVRGKTLRQLLEEHPKWPVSKTLGFASRVCLALEHAHQYTIHRDLSPENIMLTAEGRVVLLDFGIARAGENVDAATPAVSMGKAFYIAPEQRAEEDAVDARADLFSLGVIIFEMLTGQLPSGYGTLEKLRPDLPPIMGKLVSKALAPRERRFRDARTFRRALYACYQQTRRDRPKPPAPGPPAKAAPPIPEPGRPRRHTPPPPPPGHGPAANLEAAREWEEWEKRATGRGGAEQGQNHNTPVRDALNRWRHKDPDKQG